MRLDRPPRLRTVSVIVLSANHPDPSRVNAKRTSRGPLSEKNKRKQQERAKIDTSADVTSARCFEVASRIRVKPRGEKAREGRGELVRVEQERPWPDARPRCCVARPINAAVITIMRREKELKNVSVAIRRRDVSPSAFLFAAYRESPANRENTRRVRL